MRHGIVTALLLVAAAAPARADDLDALDALDASLPRAAEKVERAVVAIEVEREDKPERGLTQREKASLGLGAMSFFDPRYFLRPPGACSGVVLRLAKGDEAGTVIVTSTWNVRDAKSIKIVLPNGDRVPAVQKGQDGNLDVVTLIAQKATPGLEAAKVAPETHVGQFAVLVGRGGEREGPTVTAGNVSAVGRFKGDAIQVSARMNYGNAGGAIVDLDGRVLGIATRLTDRPFQGLNSGVGFAAPIQKLVEELDALVAGKNTPRRKSPLLGIMPELQKPLPRGKHGVLIKQIVEKSAAEKAGLKANDIIKIFNGLELEDFGQLFESVNRLEVGDKVIITVEREEYGEKDFTINLGARPEEGE